MPDFGLFLQFCLVISVSTMCEADALRDFNGTKDDELPFKKGDMLKILDRSEHNQDWYKAERSGKEGFIPAKYVRVDNDYMALNVSRLEAEELLMKNGGDGTFLIRFSETTRGDFTLSVKFGGGVQHFKVQRDGAGKYYLWVVKFNSLNQLVEYHRAESVSRSQTIFLNGLPVKPALFHVALYDYTAEEELELSFKKGDKIKVFNNSDSDWWSGVLVATGVAGQFPVNYTKESTE
ncbi:growth factor receptor-bound protein 2 isoform X1 [Strongylocentrotus purpuratus]|uniref:Growth factor receptor-bound protein 2 n=1 Tax=Strongylocentrotus purpuratus TaxID=7668 RepID=A0A7M7G0U9_STRPU|nr:growth factor receptor-bound protein 2 isoform X1 [Strongylocentrotus purpuratus]|eukprot:XP_001193089.2 PREDICTED: growth factor receptor-bound protein 2 isoform X1 [Strongylocentrotus purpuratus]